MITSVTNAGCGPIHTQYRVHWQRATGREYYTSVIDFASDIRSDGQRLRRAAIAAAYFVGLIWLIWLIASVFGVELHHYGVYPRRFDGLAGLLAAPLLHGSFVHLFSNTLPAWVLGTAYLYGYPRAARLGIPLIYLGSGFGVWIFARSSYHIGASGLIYGMMFFLITIGLLRRDRLSIALALLVFFLYGGMLWGVLPTEPGISFESHLFGAAIGTLLAFLLRNRDQARPEKRYDWEDEEDELDDLDAGDT